MTTAALFEDIRVTFFNVVNEFRRKNLDEKTSYAPTLDQLLRLASGFAAKPNRKVGMVGVLDLIRAVAVLEQHEAIQHMLVSDCKPRADLATFKEKLLSEIEKVIARSVEAQKVLAMWPDRSSPSATPRADKIVFIIDLLRKMFHGKDDYKDILIQGEFFDKMFRCPSDNREPDFPLLTREKFEGEMQQRIEAAFCYFQVPNTLTDVLIETDPKELIRRALSNLATENVLLATRLSKAESDLALSQSIVAVVSSRLTALEGLVRSKLTSPVGTASVAADAKAAVVGLGPSAPVAPTAGAALNSSVAALAASMSAGALSTAGAVTSRSSPQAAVSVPAPDANALVKAGPQPPPP